MQAPILAALVAGLAGGAIGAGVTSVLSAPETTPNENTSAIGPNTSSMSKVLEEVAALRDANAMLMGRLDVLEQTPRGTRAPAREAIPSVEKEALEEELQELVATLSDPKAPIPGFEDKVAVALENIEARKQAEREARRADEREQRIEDRLADLTSKLGLDNYQVGELRTIMAEENAARDAMMTAMREGGTRPDRAVWTTMREETQAALAKVLTPTQLEGYNESQPRRGFGGGTGGGGRGGRGN